MDNLSRHGAPKPKQDSVLGCCVIRRSCGGIGRDLAMWVFCVWDKHGILLDCNICVDREEAIEKIDTLLGRGHAEQREAG